MQKFIVLYRAPAEALAAWSQVPEETRKAGEEKMMAEWNAWMATHGSMVKETYGAGKNKRVTADGIADAANDIMLYSIVEAESQDAAAAIFIGHTHFGIPGSSIDIMPANALPEMAV